MFGLYCILFQFYVIVVGKLNVAKLANFMEMDVYVLVACPESSLIDNQVNHFTHSRITTALPYVLMEAVVV